MSTALNAPFLKAFGAALLTMLSLDAIWLTTMLEPVYRPVLGAWMRPQPDLGAALAFYLLYNAGVVALAVAPAWTQPGARLGSVAARGAALGLIAYGTYDLTNQATLQGWPWSLTLIDLAWGTTLTALCATTAWLASRPRAASPLTPKGPQA